MIRGRYGTALGRRLPSPGDDRGTMALLLMVVLVGSMLGALLVPMVISQNRSTRFDATRVQALDAAQSGIDVAIGVIRAAVSADATYGDSTKLPCGLLTGPVDGTGGLAKYSAKVEYFITDPVGEADYSGSTQSPNAMKCSAGYGVYKAGPPAVYTPSFARITSTGTVGAAVNGSSGGRTLVTTYVFKTAINNIAGGLIRISPTGSASLCMDAGSATAIAGTSVKLQTCSTTTPPIAQQTFAYRIDLTLQLLSSVTTANPRGLCLAPTASPPAATNGVQLSQCSAIGSPVCQSVAVSPCVPWIQQWSYNDNGQYQASLSTSQTDGVLSTVCMDAASQAAGVPLTLADCGSAAGWIPSPSVGSGAAALPQWINYSEFGRCLDVTNAVIGSPHLIDYPCKQNPFSGAVKWNQKFVAPTIVSPQTSVTGQISTTVTGSPTQYCLTSPGTIGGYVTMSQVCGSGGATQTWKLYGGDKSLTYAQKYTIVDNTGLCLGLTTPASDQPNWSAIDVETCTGATEQKWNASPISLNSALQNTREIPAGK